MPHRVRDTAFSLSPEPEIARTAAKQRVTKGGTTHKEVLRGYARDGRPDDPRGISQGRKCRPAHAARTGRPRSEGAAGAGRNRGRTARARRQAAKADPGGT